MIITYSIYSKLILKYLEEKKSTQSLVTPNQHLTCDWSDRRLKKRGKILIKYS